MLTTSTRSTLIWQSLGCTHSLSDFSLLLLFVFLVSFVWFLAFQLSETGSTNHQTKFMKTFWKTLTTITKNSKFLFRIEVTDHFQSEEAETATMMPSWLRERTRDMLFNNNLERWKVITMSILSETLSFINLLKQLSSYLELFLTLLLTLDFGHFPSLTDNCQRFSSTLSYKSTFQFSTSEISKELNPEKWLSWQLFLVSSCGQFSGLSHSQSSC